MTDYPAMKREPPPSIEHYVTALRRTSPLTDTQLAMLNVHFRAADRTITASQMAKALGFHHYSRANAQYGRLGRLVGEQLDYNPMQERLGSLVTFEKREGEWHWLMRPQFAAALQTLGLVDEYKVAETYSEFAGPVASDINLATTRVATTTLRIIRDTTLAQTVKALHCYCCQICGATIELRDGNRYAEAHHIKPLGSPHDGPDVAGNILVLCPNHHAMCDYGSISLDLGQLATCQNHEIDAEFICYHNSVIVPGIAK